MDLEKLKLKLQGLKIVYCKHLGMRTFLKNVRSFHCYDCNEFDCTQHLPESLFGDETQYWMKQCMERKWKWYKLGFWCEQYEIRATRKNCEECLVEFKYQELNAKHEECIGGIYY